MKRLLFAAALASTTFPAFASDVGVSISIGQPGFYGRLDIGGYPQPRVIYRQPRVMYQAAMSRPPIYLNVPPGHAKNWRKHCREYNACGERVYFVQNTWYDREYVPRYMSRVTSNSIVIAAMTVVTIIAESRTTAMEMIAATTVVRAVATDSKTSS